MVTMTRWRLLWTWTALLTAAVGCGDDDDGELVDRLGVGAECARNADCPRADGGPLAQACLMQFKGGYCGIENCQAPADCPPGSRCVAHDDGENYCFRTCLDKSECNRNRTPDNEANCSSNVTYVDESKNDARKACVPPSG